ncbi:MAG TPA: serine/threonine-protein kinase [Myxococcales bacterium]|jgi:serine/threonine-protein kinase
MSATATSLFAGYQVVRKLSEGVAAEVFLARPDGLGPSTPAGAGCVVSEVMRPELVEDPAVVARFLLEAENRLDLVHPNLARRVKDGISSDGRPFVISETVGESLASRLAADGPMRLERALPLLLQVCEALEFLHGRGMVHANLKPASIYLSSGDPPQVKLLDFGLALLRPGRTLPCPRSVVLVEPEYLAPERVRGQRATPASDVYGLGVLVYELLTGAPPFTGSDSSAVRRRQVEEPATPLPAPLAVVAPLVDRCLAKEPRDRFPSIAAVKAALAELHRSECAAAPLPAATAEEAPAAPEHIGPYELLAPLGEGATGRVFMARHRTLGRRVALKVLKPELARCKAEVDRFVLEAQAVNKVSNEHIVQIYDCSDEALPGGGRRVYLVMDLLEGQSLADALRQGPLPLRRGVRIMRQVASALDAGHRAGVVHRDLKPDNVFVTTERGTDFAKLLDFGVAKLRNRTAEGTDGRLAVGTPGYMAPEQVRGSWRTDHRADVWGIGVVLYRLLAGTLPFVGRTFEELGGNILSQPLPPLPAATPRGEPIPGPLKTLVEGCLEKSAEKRPQTMAEVCTALDGVLADWIPATQPPAKVHSFPKPSRPVWPFVVLGFGLALAVAGTAGLGLLWTRLPAAPDPTAAPAAPVVAARPAPIVFSRLPAAEVEVSAPAAIAPRTIALDTAPSGARVVRTADGTELGLTPLEIAAPRSGELSLLVRLPGHQETVVRLRPDSPALSLVRLAALPAAKAPAQKGRSK